jgi:hypothetical protein
MVFFCSFFHCRDKQPIAGLAHWSSMYARLSLLLTADISSTVPERRNADINLPCIPQDVYLAIFDQIQRDEHGDDRNFKLLLINLSLVCRFFNAVFVPRLFESIRVLQDTRGKGPYPRAISFCKDLINDREPARTLGLHVRSCTFGKLGHRNLKFAQHSKAILRFVNLRSLSLSGIVITSTLFEAISALEHLTSLSINHSQLSPDLDSIPNLTLHLTSFTFVGIYSLSPFSGRLARLVASPSVRVLHTSCVDFLRVFMSQPIEFGLEELTFPLTGNAIPDLVRFLNRTPTITTLSFLIYSWETPMSFNGLLPSALPRLKALHCPSCLAADFIPGRPLKRINLDAPAIPTQAGVGFAETSLGDGCRLFSLLRQSTAAIEMLHVPVDMYYVASFGDNFPALRILHLECPAHRKQSEVCSTVFVGSMAP